MRIAFLTDFYLPNTGGQETRFAELATRLVGRGHEVTVMCVRHAADLPTVEMRDGVRVLRQPLSLRYDEPRIDAFGRKPLATIRFAWATRRVLRAQRFDLVYFNQWPGLHILAAPAAVRRAAAIDWCEVRGGVVYGTVQRRFPRLVRFNFCVNGQGAEELSAQSGVTVEYLPSGVVTERYRSLPRSQREGLLFIGRLTDSKNLPLLIQGFGELWERGWRQPLQIGGDGPLRDQLRRDVDALPDGARQAVRLLGRVSDEDKIDLLSRSAVLLLPSRREGFPVVVAEAMASGLPVATVDTAGNGTAHVVRSYGNGIVGADTPAGVADAVLATMERWEELSAAGLSAVPQLHWDAVLDRLLERVSL